MPGIFTTPKAQNPLRTDEADITDVAANHRRIGRIERYYDQVPRFAAMTEELGPFTLFVATGPWAYYARPRLGSDIESAYSAADVAAVVARQKEYDTAVQFEWQHELAPALAEACASVGLQVRRHPLMVHEGRGDGSTSAPAAAEPSAAAPRIEILRRDDVRLAQVRAAIDVGWTQVDTAIGPAGVAERDARVTDPAVLAFARTRLAAGTSRIAAAFSPTDGPIAGGTHIPVGSVTEIVGVSVMPAFRRRGLAGGVAAALVDDACAAGIDTVFLSANDDDVARIYARVGFRRMGTACVATG